MDKEIMVMIIHNDSYVDYDDEMRMTASSSSLPGTLIPSCLRRSFIANLFPKEKGEPAEYPKVH